ncbi:MAG: VWA domain-containing protein [Betaproteobacteria bacterium]|nr:VWA domain-containing protein [Betaproteobacteria bacterium]
MNSSARFSDNAPLDAAEIEERFEELVGAVLSSRRTATALSQELARQPRAVQEFTLHWVAITARSSPELAYQFATVAPGAIGALGVAGAEKWLLEAMDVFDREGLYRAAASLKDLAGFIRQARAQAGAVAFPEVARVLEHFLAGLSGRPMKLEADDVPWTDTDTVYLPRRITRYGRREENFRAYKVTAALLWAQARHGTFSLDAKRYPGTAPGLALLAALESIRLAARFERELPGLHRDLELLRQPAIESHFEPVVKALRSESAGVADSLLALQRLPADARAPDWVFLGRLEPQRALGVRAERIARDRQALQSAVARLRAEMRAADGGATAPAEAARLRVAVREMPGDAQQLDISLELDGRTMAPTPEVSALIESILQDLGELPEEYLVAAGDGAYRTENAGEPAELVPGIEAPAEGLLYDEWDFRRRHYRKDWCVLAERDVQPGDSRFVPAALIRYRAEVWHLRRSFEALRGEDRRLRGEPWGDEVDLDAAVRALTEMRSGAELAERLFVRRERKLRDMAVMFVVDMSGSTKGWINDCEREALVLLAEALEVLGDRYAIYGFSGITRKRCEVYRVKRFDERYGGEVQQRIAGIQPLDYTRMGVALRHLTGILAAQEARTRLMITLSDGKPDDFSDGYRGEYGIEDTRQALLEAKRAGIHSFCITIDREARDYLPRMYGAAHYTVIEDVARLPLKVAEVYRRLTS